MLAARGFKRRNSEKQHEDTGLILHRSPHDGSRRKIELRPDSQAWPTCLPTLRNLEHILKSAQTVWRGVDDRAPGLPKRCLPDNDTCAKLRHRN